jgi:paraquat-inducible protein B
MQRLFDSCLRAQLRTESLVTGKLLIELDYHPDTEIRLTAEDKAYVEIPTIPSDLQRFAQNLMDLPLPTLFDKLMDTVDSLIKILESPQIPETITSLKAGVDDTKKLVEEIQKQIEPFIENLNSTVEEYSRLAKDTNDRLGPLISGIEETVGDHGKLARNVDSKVDPLAKDADKR